MFGVTDETSTDRTFRGDPFIRISDVDVDKENALSRQSSKSEQNPSWDDYTIDSVLGQGAYGKVFKVHKKIINFGKNGE